MKNKYQISVVILGLGLASCASMTHRGVVAMKLDSTEAHVGMGGKELSVGDHVDLYHNQCTQSGNLKNGTPRTCVKKEGGHGIVTSIISDDYSLVRFEPGVEFSEGDMVEKHAH